MTARTLRLSGFLLGAAALAGTASTGGCKAVVRDFGTGGEGGGTGSATSTSTGQMGGGGSATCTPGDEVECYGGPPGTNKVGICKPGMKVCNKTGDGFGPCTGDVQPKPEDCATPDDEDCDGKTPACPLTNLWANEPGVAGNDNVARAVAVGNQGFIFVTGLFEGTVAFDPQNPAGVTSAGAQDLYVAKYGPDGSFKWVKTYGDASDQLGTGIAVGKNGHIYVTGSYSGNLNFGGNYNFISAGGDDVFVLELDQDGSTIAAVSGGDASDQDANALALNSKDEVLIGGTFNGTFSFTGLPAVSTDTGEKVFLARFAPDLTPMQLVASGGMGTQELTGLAVGPDDSVAVTGSFDSEIVFDNVDYLSVDMRDVFVGKFDGAGLNLKWARAYNGAKNDRGAGVTFDSQGNVLLGGYFGGTLMLDNISLVSSSNSSLFLAKLSPTGDVLWAHTYADSLPGLNLPVAVATTVKDNVVMGGCYYGTANFGGGALTSIGSPDDLGILDAYLAEFDSAGQYIAAKSFGNMSIQAGFGLAIAPQGDILYCGATGGPLDFGTGSVGPADLMVVSPFLARFAP